MPFLSRRQLFELMGRATAVGLFGIMAEDQIDPTSGDLVTRYTQDVQPTLDHNAELRVHGGDGYSESRELRRVASIPLVVCHMWMKEGINVFDPNDRDKVLRRLNDPNWSYLRTAPGNI